MPCSTACAEVTKNHEARQRFTQQQTENKMVLKVRRCPFIGCGPGSAVHGMVIELQLHNIPPSSGPPLTTGQELSTPDLRS